MCRSAIEDVVAGRLGTGAIRSTREVIKLFT
jgi:hypothetical protein